MKYILSKTFKLTLASTSAFLLHSVQAGLVKYENTDIQETKGFEKCSRKLNENERTEWESYVHCLTDNFLGGISKETLIEPKIVDYESLLERLHEIATGDQKICNGNSKLTQREIDLIEKYYAGYQEKGEGFLEDIFDKLLTVYRRVSRDTKKFRRYFTKQIAEIDSQKEQIQEKIKDFSDLIHHIEIDFAESFSNNKLFNSIDYANRESAAPVFVDTFLSYEGIDRKNIDFKNYEQDIFCARLLLRDCLYSLLNKDGATTIKQLMEAAKTINLLMLLQDHIKIRICKGLSRSCTGQEIGSEKMTLFLTLTDIADKGVVVHELEHALGHIFDMNIDANFFTYRSPLMYGTYGFDPKNQDLIIERQACLTFDSPEEMRVMVGAVEVKGQVYIFKHMIPFFLSKINYFHNSGMKGSFYNILEKILTHQNNNFLPEQWKKWCNYPVDGISFRTFYRLQTGDFNGKKKWLEFLIKVQEEKKLHDLP